VDLLAQKTGQGIKHSVIKLITPLCPTSRPLFRLVKMWAQVGHQQAACNTHGLSVGHLL
jgi:hypothetical protein